ncbi:MAG TPA: hypothetical protein VFL80_01140, partial [Thermoanaerobaculia bacterium]|nr:hypothetical protein [Thermoanaerobaculia bacterium]
MTELPSSAEPPKHHEPQDTPPAPLFPRWVPILIAALLVVFAALALFTGLRYRESPAATVLRAKAVPRSPATPPGEPQPGGSLVFGDREPVAGAPAAGRARAVIAGDAAGIQSVVRIWARRGLVINAVPADALVSVNDVMIGQANQFDTADETYDFPAPGSYNIRISAP